MEIRLRHGAREFHLRLSREDGGFLVTLDGTPHRIACLATGPSTRAAGGTTVEELGLEVDGRASRALIAIDRGCVLVALGGRVYRFEQGDAERATTSATARSGSVVAPMPGKVVRVLVASGDAVEPGQPLVVLEAMKMESTLVAEIAGRVTAVLAAAGTVVAGGDLLIQIAPT